MPANRPFLERLNLSGYKSIREAELEFAKLNVLIGANGEGKSNLVSFFSLLPAALDQKFDAYVGRHGGPNALLYFGPRRTSETAAAATVRTAAGTGPVDQRLGFRAPDSMFYHRRQQAAELERLRAGRRFVPLVRVPGSVGVSMGKSNDLRIPSPEFPAGYNAKW